MKLKCLKLLSYITLFNMKLTQSTRIIFSNQMKFHCSTIVPTTAKYSLESFHLWSTNYITYIHQYNFCVSVYCAWENIGGGKNWRIWRIVNHSSIFLPIISVTPLHWNHVSPFANFLFANWFRLAIRQCSNPPIFSHTWYIISLTKMLTL